VEKKLGKAFRENWIDSTALVLAPEFIFKDNLKTYEFPRLDSLEEWEQDSLLLAGSLFLKDIDDSVLMDRFIGSFTGRLQKHGFSVMRESSIDQFLTEHQHGLVFNFAQVSIEEFVHPYNFDYDLFGEAYSVTDIDLNAISINVWIEVSRLNSQTKNKVLFASDFLTDELDGYFRQYIFTGETKFEYTIDTISTSDIEDFADMLGSKYADNLYDYFLNEYVRSNAPENYSQNLRPLHWDLERRVFVFKEDEQNLIEIEPEGDQ
jgi:hypothetical protein